MFRWRRLCAAGFTAVAAFVYWFCLSVGPSRAAEDEESRVILFSGRDLWRNGAFAYGGLLMAPGGFEHDGLLLKVLISGGLYRYNTSNVVEGRVIGLETAVQVLPGVRIKRGDLEAKFFFGPDYERHRLWPDDSGNKLRGSSFGLRMAIDLWYEPTPATMAAMDASLSSIATSSSARVAFGVRVLDNQFYFGPEIAIFDSEGYRHLRIGGHFTAMKTGDAEWTAAGGWARDSDGRAGPYVRLNLMQRM